MPSPFGPHYPSELQRAVNHAERLADLVATAELVSAEQPWALGRSEEIAGYVTLVVADWRAGTKTEAEAAGAVDSYVGELHDSMRRIFGIAQPRCCNTTSTADEGPFSGT